MFNQNLTPEGDGLGAVTLPRKYKNATHGLVSNNQMDAKLEISSNGNPTEISCVENYLNTQRLNAIQGNGAGPGGRSGRNHVQKAQGRGAKEILMFNLPLAKARSVPDAIDVVNYAGASGVKKAAIPVLPGETVTAIISRLRKYQALALKHKTGTQWIAAVDVSKANGVANFEVLALTPGIDEIAVIARGKSALHRHIKKMGLTIGEKGIKAWLLNAPQNLDEEGSTPFFAAVHGFYATSLRLNRGMPGDYKPNPFHVRAERKILYNAKHGSFELVEDDPAWTAQANSLIDETDYNAFWGKVSYNNLEVHKQQVDAWKASSAPVTFLQRLTKLWATLTL